ncbi:MAG: hypothetical protein AAGC93_28235 [Cyanobacteria bacterium P01_F01_bin.53]
MKPSLLISAGSLLMASMLAWQTPSKAQGVCYFVDSAGQVVDLGHLCEGSSNSEGAPSPSSASGTSSEATSPRTTSYTIIGPVRSASSSPSSSTTSATSSTTRAIDPFDRGSRTIRIRSIQTEDFTITTIDNPDRVVNGVLIEGRDQLIIGPGVQQHPDSEE